MIRVVGDTNIIVSSFFWGGLPRMLLDAARSKRCQLITTEELIVELIDVLSRPKFAGNLAGIGETEDTLIDDDFRALVEVVEPAMIPPVILDDPDDDLLIACAIGGAADYIVSGDHHLLDLGTYKNIKIGTVREFLETELE